MQSKLPEYVSRSVPVPLAGRTPWYKSTFPDLCGNFSVGRFLPEACRADARLCIPCSLFVGLAGGRAALLCALLLCARYAWHADRPSAVRGGSVDLRNDGRIFYSRIVDGRLAGGLGSGDRRGFSEFHNEWAEPDLEEPLQHHRGGVGL